MDSSSKHCAVESRTSCMRHGQSESSTVSALYAWDCLPDELVARILAVLPYSNIYLARGVCKRWRSIIWSPLFLSMCHLKPARMPWLVEFQQHMYNQAWAYDLQGRQWFHLNFFFLPENASIVATSGGLVCLRRITGTDCSLFICNPLTKDWKRLPAVSLAPSIVLLDVDQHSGNYRVIVLILRGQDGADSSRPNGSVYVFDSRMRTWKEIQGLPLSMHVNSVRDATVFAGVLYCLTTERRMEIFDIEKGTWSNPILCNMGVLHPQPHLQPHLHRLVLRLNIPGNRFDPDLGAESYICGQKGRILMVTSNHSMKGVVIDELDVRSRCWSSHHASAGRVICAGRFSSLSTVLSKAEADIYLSHSEGSTHYSFSPRSCRQLPRSPLTRHKIQGTEVIVKKLWFEPRIDATT